MYYYQNNLERHSNNSAKYNIYVYVEEILTNLDNLGTSCLYKSA